MKRSFRQVLVVTAVAVSLAACGGSDSDGLDAVEDAIDDITSGSVSVDISTDDAAVEQGEGTDLPDDFPSDIPLPEDGGPSLTATYSDATIWNLVYTMEDTSAEVCEGYLDRFADSGYTETGRFESMGDFTGIFANDLYDVTVSCGPTGGVTMQVAKTAG